MKRGFLNKQATKGMQKNKPDSSSTVATKIPIAAQLATVPQIAKIEPGVPAQGKIPSFIHGAMNMVTLPYPTPGQKDWSVICLLYPGTKEALLALPGFPAPPPHRFASIWDLPYYLKDVPGMGYSVVAATALQAGDLILCERPLLLVPIFRFKGTDSAMDQAINIVKKNRRFDLNHLSNCKGPDVSRSRGIIDTNALDAGRLPGPYDGGHAVICMDLSRINHRSGLYWANIAPSPNKE